jgi:hypothetical protein
LTEFISRDDDGDQGEEDDAMEAQFTVIIAGKPHTGTVRVFPGTTTDVEYYLNGKIYIKNDMQNVDDYDDFIENAAGYIQEIIQLKGDGHHFVEQGVAETYLQELSPELLKRASDAASAKYDIAADYGNRLPADTAQALMKHYGQQSARFAQGAKSAQQRDAEKATLSKIGMSDVARRKTGMTENDPWGPAGRFAGDVKTDISSTVEKFQPRVGQTVKVRDGNIKGLGEITRIKGDTASVWIHSYAREFEVPMSAISAAEVRESRSAIASAIAAAKL